MKTAIFSLALMVAGSMAHADSSADANARLAFSDKMSMYSQRIIGSTCAMTSQAAPFEARGFQGTARIEVNRILKALEKGDRALGIQLPEQNEDILALLEEIQRVWLPIDALSRTIRAGRANENFQQDLEKHLDSFTEASVRLSSVISSKYVDTDSLRLSDAIRIQIAGRQRMLAQKISFEACSIGKGKDANRALLAETREYLELSQRALLDGMPAAGLVPTTEPELITALERVDRLWAEIRWPIIGLENGAQWDARTQTAMYLKLNELTHEMDKAVIVFTKAANTSGS